MQIIQIMEKKIIISFQHAARRIIEHEFYRAVHNNAVRHAFLYEGRIVGCKNVYIIFFIIIIT